MGSEGNRDGMTGYDPFAALMRPSVSDAELFRSRYDSDRVSYHPPSVFDHAKDYHVATFRKHKNEKTGVYDQGDGFDVQVWECRWPARFFTVVALPTANSVGEMRPGFRLSFGSGQERIAAMLAQMIADGMLSAEMLPEKVTA